ncbi:MAG: acyltransferase family protein [Mycobacterium sp.]|uniref:acyltransferase family protein n=1 Tax=Mycobacterium sp. TaxID=1785 RepID=UPI002608D51A|nr:acyltransferase family protein [Mycobacterium sp.]MDI3315333.1 acyltransferase family protein [Mycobacterium sp.]
MPGSGGEVCIICGEPGARGTSHGPVAVRRHRAVIKAGWLVRARRFGGAAPPPGRHRRVNRTARRSRRPGNPLTRPAIPALDGVRALAIVLVLADHGGIPGVRGGFIGVDVFFVLSGFLITSLLLAGDTGRLDLPGFWARRARRLLPALVVMVLAVGVARGLFPPDAVSGLRTDALAAFFWVANWNFVAHKTDYFSQGGARSPLEHTWSLGVEEQFYVVWPLLLTAVGALLVVRARRRRTPVARSAVRMWVGLLAVSGALASAGAAIVWASDAALNRVYFGTDTRAQALLIGAAASAVLVRDWPALAAGRPPARSRRVRAVAEAVSVAGLTGLAAAAHFATGSAAEFRRGLLVLVALAAVAVIAPAALSQRTTAARVLAWRPLAALGVISYGVYLWHWPVFLTITGQRTGWSGWALFAVRCLVTLALATVSWWLIERPIRRLAPTGARLLPLAGATVATAAAVTALVIPVGTRPGDPVTRDRPLSAPPATSSSSAAPIPAPPVSAVVAQRDPLRPRTISVFGDSIAWTLMRYLPQTPGFTFIDHTTLGCGVVRGGPYRYFGQIHDQQPECDTWPTRWPQQVAQDRPDVVLLLVGRWETMDRVHDGRWTHIGDPAFDAYLFGELQRAFTVLDAPGARLMVATEPYNRRGEQPDGSLYPEDLPDRVTRWNALLRQTLAQHPNIGVLDLNKKLCPDSVYTDNVDGIRVRSDGVHLTPEAVTWLTPWLERSIR